MSNTLLIPQHVADSQRNKRVADRAENCGNCKWRVQGTQDIECRKHPPTAALLMVPIAATQGPIARPGAQQVGIGPQAFSVFPLIKDDLWCGEWEPKLPN